MAELKVLSPQEERIEYEIKHNTRKFDNPNRAAEILKTIRNAKPQIDIERGLFFTESFQETEGKPLILRWAKALTEETTRLTYNPVKELTSRYIVNETASFRSLLQWVHDYEIVMEKGFGGIRAEAVERLSKLDEYSPIDNTEKKPFLEAEILTCDAIILWAHRHAEAARALAEKETDVTRKKELGQIAKICDFPELPKKVRTPIIPGFNDTAEDVRKILDFIKDRPNVSYEPLPYHSFGKGKYKALGREYAMGDVKLAPEKMKGIECSTAWI